MLVVGKYSIKHRLHQHSNGSSTDSGSHKTADVLACFLHKHVVADVADSDSTA